MLRIKFTSTKCGLLAIWAILLRQWRMGSYGDVGWVVVSIIFAVACLLIPTAEEEEE